MKFLCLAYGDEHGWKCLNEVEQREALAQDTVIRDRGNFMSAVRPEVTTVRNRDGNRVVSEHALAGRNLPLAGFSVIEAGNLGEVVELVSSTPCAIAGGAIEIRPLWDTGDGT